MQNFFGQVHCSWRGLLSGRRAGCWSLSRILWGVRGFAGNIGRTGGFVAFVLAEGVVNGGGKLVINIAGPLYEFIVDNIMVVSYVGARRVV